MNLTPLEIRKQEFKKSMRGYDPVEVDTFLELVADGYETLIQENSNLNKQLLSAEAELKHFKEVEKTLKQTLYNVQETSQLSKENSQKEASLIKKEAELAASRMLEKARLEVHKMKDEVAGLRQQKESFISRLRHLLASQLELLDVLEIDDADREDLKDRTKKMFPGHKKETVRSRKHAKAPVSKGLKTTPKPGSQKKMDDPAKPDPQNRKTDGVKKQGDEFFKDIFGDDLDVDEILK